MIGNQLAWRQHSSEAAARIAGDVGWLRGAAMAGDSTSQNRFEPFAVSEHQNLILFNSREITIIIFHHLEKEKDNNKLFSPSPSS